MGIYRVVMKGKCRYFRYFAKTKVKNWKGEYIIKGVNLNFKKLRLLTLLQIFQQLS